MTAAGMAAVVGANAPLRSPLLLCERGYAAFVGRAISNPSDRLTPSPSRVRRKAALVMVFAANDPDEPSLAEPIARCAPNFGTGIALTALKFNDLPIVNGLR